MKSLISILSTLSASVLLCVSASAHTISIGSYNAGIPGSVTLVMGTYDHGTPIAQGAITLTGGPGIPPSITQNFSSYLLSKPTGLVDGVNNFYANATSGSYGTLASDSFTSAVNNVGLGPVVNWQAATFTGLSAGTYTYQLSGMTSANWININSIASNWSGTLVIPEESISGVPDAGATLGLLGLAFAAVGFWAPRRSKRFAAQAAE